MEGCEDRKKLLRQRTKKYASEVIRLYCELPKNRMECQVIGKQLLRSGTSVAANYREASRARSGAEFIAKVDGVEKSPTAALRFILRRCGVL